MSFGFLFLCLACQAPKLSTEAPLIGFLDAFEDETIDKARVGFLAALAEAGFDEEKGTLQVLYRNAQGDIPTLVQACDYLLSQPTRLIACNPTSATITATQRSKATPVCMMVSSHPSLIGLVDSEGIPPPTLFGTYETLDYISQSVRVMKQILPKLKKAGLIYNQAEAQSVNALKTIQKTADELGLELIIKPVNNSSETQLIVESLLNEDIEAFFAMPDNVVFASFEVIFKSCQQYKVPIFTSEEGLVKRGALAAYGADMYQWGYQAGKSAALYLQSPPDEVPPLEAVSTHRRMYNPEMVRQFNLKMGPKFEPVQLSQEEEATERKLASNARAQSSGNFYTSALMLGLAFASLGLGIFISMRIFEIPDITTDGSYTLGGCAAAVMLVHDLPLGLIILAVITLGAVAGMITGFIHAKLEVNALLAGILVMTALYSVNLSLMGRSNIPLLGTNNLLEYLPGVSPYTSQLLSLLLIVFLLCLFLSYLLKTDFGLAMRATGDSESMIRANGVDTDWMKILGLGLSNAFVALSGMLIVQYQGFADINMGIGIVIIGLGSVMIGESLSTWLGLRKIQYRVLGVVLGTIAFRLILALTLAIGIDPSMLKLVTALLVLLVVAFPKFRSRD